MEFAPQRLTVVIEHASATMDLDDEDQGDENPWSLVAYLVVDSGQRERATLHRCKTRAEASAAIGRIWSGISTIKSLLATAA